ncbi:hypothetical protein DSL72_002548 [Monilinia vaccinii-corymbosi]|uniref:Heterokaryon incompatibility domain-containing protein n=1 Tax=Monilinia vaccinii-corymbosi TaxID=61207 RepID=A0A8A3PCZ6_9HELO|nr:hypothetical protein DSL72_002548 [Monilinia vaccinii-corymbosi]
MRFLECNGAGKISLAKTLVDKNLPAYAILSHTWGEDGSEVTFQDLTNGAGEDKSGYSKIHFCGEQARCDGLRYFWVDTCCIDKSSSAELTEAINSMFNWYRKATRCYVYLSDVSTSKHDLVDALDECDQSQARSMVCFFEELCELAENKRVRLQICFSSRHYPTIVIHQGLEVILEGQSGHTEDIKHYIKSKLRLGKSKPAESLQSEILGKSSGIFLWVVLVLDILNSEYPSSSISIKKIRERLKGIPPGLTDFQEVDIPDVLPHASASEAVELRTTLNSKFPFLYYAASNVLCHANDAQQDAIQQDDFLAEFPLRRWISLRNALEKYEIRRYTTSVSLYYILADNGLANLIRICPQNGSCFDLTKERYGPAIFAALANGSYKSVQSLLENEATTYPPTSRVHEVLKQFYQRGNKSMDRSRKVTFSRKELILRQLLKYDQEILFNNLLLSENLSSDRDILSQPSGSTGLNMLSMAAHIGQEMSVKFLLEMGVEIDIVDMDHRTPLMKAVAAGHENIARLLFKKGAKIDFEDRNKQTPLMKAVEGGHESIVKLLLEDGANFKAFKQGSGMVKAKTGLHKAAAIALTKGHPNILKLLLGVMISTAKMKLRQQGVAVVSKDRYDRTPLLRAAKGGHEFMVKHLLKKGAEIDSRDVEASTPLSHAASQGHKAIVELLLQESADIDSKDKNGCTPLLWAASSFKEREAVVRLLLENGADINAKSGSGRTSLSYAIALGHPNVFKLLLDKGANVDSEDENV